MAKRSLKNISIAFILIVVSIITGVSFAFMEIVTRRLIDIEKDENLQNTISLSRECDMYINRSFEFLDIMNTNISDGNIPASRNSSYLAAVLKSSSYFDMLVLLDSTGRVKSCYPDSEEFQSFDFSGNDFFRQVSRGSLRYISPVFVSMITGKPTITIAIPVKSGVLAGDLNMSTLEEKLENYGGRSSWASLTDSRGIYIVHPDRSFVSQRVNGASLEYISRALHGQPGNYLVMENGKNVNVSSVPATASGWVLSVHKSLDAMLSPLKMIRNALLVMFFVMTLIFASFFAFVFLKGVNPFIGLVRQMNAIGQGDYSDVPVSSKIIEVDTILRRFREMTDAIRKRESGLVVSEQRLEKIFQTMRDCISFVDEKIIVRYSNVWSRKILDLNTGASYVGMFCSGKKALDENDVEISISDLPVLRAIDSRMDQLGNVYRIDFEGRESMWVLENVYALFRPDGSFEGVLSNLRDITELKEFSRKLQGSLAEKDILIKEIHHRVKNNMQVVSSLLSIQASSMTDETSIRVLDECRGRVKTMALVHEKLYLSSDFSHIEFLSYLRSLVRNIFAGVTFDVSSVVAEVTGDENYISIDNAIPCGLIVNELVTNSLKHAFKSAESGKVFVDFRMIDDEYIIKVADDGCGFHYEDFSDGSKSLGLTLVRLLVRQIGASFNVNSGSSGSEFVVRFAADENFIYRPNNA